MFVFQFAVFVFQFAVFVFRFYVLRSPFYVLSSSFFIPPKNAVRRCISVGMGPHADTNAPIRGKSSVETCVRTQYRGAAGACHGERNGAAAKRLR